MFSQLDRRKTMLEARSDVYKFCFLVRGSDTIKMSAEGEEEFIPNEDDGLNMEEDFFEDEDAEGAEIPETADTSNRSIKSLGMLTKRFIKFLQDSPVGLVDINLVSTYIHCHLRN
jgi:hypothetical protein